MAAVATRTVSLGEAFVPVSVHTPTVVRHFSQLEVGVGSRTHCTLDDSAVMNEVSDEAPDKDVLENIDSNSRLSSSVERLVEVTRRLTVCNQLQSAIESRAETAEDDTDPSSSDAHVPSTLRGEKEGDKGEEDEEVTCQTRPQVIVDSCRLDDTIDTAGQSPQIATKKWVKLLGISPEDIGDEEEFIKAATAITNYLPPSPSSTLSSNEQRALRQSWNAALDAAHFGSLESMESGASGDLKRSSSWKNKMSLPFFSKRCTQVKSLQLDELAKMIASGKPSYEQVHRWRKSFEALLADKYGLALFKDFLTTEFSDENIEFWIACEEYKTITQPKKQQARAQKIYEDFIATQACREINLDSVTREQTIAELASPNAHTFENAQKRIQALMERDSYGRFLRSDLFLTLLNQAKQAARELAAAAREGYDGGSGGSGNGGGGFGDSSRFRLASFIGGGGGLGGPLRSGGGGVGTDLPGVLAAAADAEAGMNSVQDLELLGLSTSRHMRNMSKNAANSRATSSGNASSTSPSKSPMR